MVKILGDDLNCFARKMVNHWVRVGESKYSPFIGYEEKMRYAYGQMGNIE